VAGSSGFCQNKYSGYIDGNRLLEVMNRCNLTERDLARSGGVSEQTVRNYLSSTAAKPRKANSRIYSRICDALGIEVEELMLPFQDSIPGGTSAEQLDSRLIGNSSGFKSLEGNWHVSSEFSDPSSAAVTASTRTFFQGRVTVRQLAVRIEIRGSDPRFDLFAKGSLLENGRWLRMTLWAEGPKAVHYGQALLNYSDCGGRLEGTYQGREAYCETSTMLIGKFSMKRQPIAAK
jgi:transcriptional regulator with XRE-family HTH domain